MAQIGVFSAFGGLCAARVAPAGVVATGAGDEKVVRYDDQGSLEFSAK